MNTNLPNSPSIIVVRTLIIVIILAIGISGCDITFGTESSPQDTPVPTGIFTIPAEEAPVAPLEKTIDAGLCQNSFWPIASDASWTYQVTSEDASGYTETRVDTWSVFDVAQSSFGVGGNFVVRRGGEPENGVRATSDTFRCDEKGIYDLSLGPEPELILPPENEFTIGNSWTYAQGPYQTPQQLVNLSQKSLPFGTFLVADFDNQGMQMEYWVTRSFAQGVGMVFQQISDDAHTVRYELIDYQLPASPASIPGQQETSIAYVVQQGDTLTSIAMKFNVSINSIVSANNLSLTGSLYVGQVLTIPNPTVKPPAELSAMTRTTDGMVYVPQGEFTMGNLPENTLTECRKFRSDCQLEWFIHGGPPHQVYLDAYWIDRTEVTNAMYSTCVSAGVCQPPSSNSSNNNSNYYSNKAFDNHPVVFVTWYQADVYCKWSGGRLPTEAEWEKAARGTDGRTYPWGEGLDCSKANYYAYSQNNYCVGTTTPVGAYEGGKSPYGAMDMSGNVSEWVADWYLNTYYQSSPYSNPTGPASGIARGFRGGSWGDNENNVRTTMHTGISPDYSNLSIGFRCALSEQNNSKSPASNAAMANEARVRYILIDAQLGGVIDYYRLANDPESTEAVRRWDAGIRVTNTGQFERKQVNGQWQVVHAGTETTINGMDIILTTDN